MCFSATASFGISAALLAGGVASLKKAKTPKQIPFAMIPFVFSVQQVCEGFVWLSFKDPAYAGTGIGATYAFLVFAQVIWPSLVPYSIYLMEEDPSKKKILRILTITGVILSIYLLFSLLFYPVKASAGAGHIAYDLDRPVEANYITAVLYVIAIIAPPFVSGIRKMSGIGFFNLVSFLITVVFFSENIISIWCFFAAAISIGVFLVLKGSAVIKTHAPVQS
jgi:hypothetical protein